MNIGLCGSGPIVKVFYFGVLNLFWVHWSFVEKWNESKENLRDARFFISTIREINFTWIEHMQACFQRMYFVEKKFISIFFLMC